MKSIRGAANLARFNKVRAERTEELMRVFLKEAKRARLTFRSVGSLAAKVSSSIGVHRTTLGRNPTYAAMLLEYIHKQAGGVETIEDSKADPETLRVKLRASQAKVGVLQHELKRLKELTPSTSVGSLEGDQFEFGNLAMLLCLVLERVADTMRIDFSNHEIVDLAARPSQRIVAGPERVRCLVDWIELNQALLLAVNLPRSLFGMPEASD